MSDFLYATAELNISRARREIKKKIINDIEYFDKLQPSSPIQEAEADVLGKEAESLVAKFNMALPNTTFPCYKNEAAKQCALIAVDMVIEALKRQNPNFEDNTYWSPIDYQQQLRQYIQSL